MTPKLRTRVAAPLLFAAGVLGGCAGKLPPCPAAGGPAWRELASAHFRLRTDADPESARGTLRDLEQFQAALLTVFRAARQRHLQAGDDTAEKAVELAWEDPSVAITAVRTMGRPKPPRP